MKTEFVFHPIGVIHSCFTEKFGIPRQPGLTPAARATLEIFPPYDQADAFKGIEQFSHLWIVFVFHGIAGARWRATVRPPRLGGNRRIGVFATRSGYRPNPIGISAVKLKGRRRHQKKLLLDLSGIDLLDQTPVLDIKPYLPYADAVADAAGGFASAPPQRSLAVKLTDRAQSACRRIEKEIPGFRELLCQVLTADPRPAYLAGRDTKTVFGMRLYGLNVRWTVARETIWVQTIVPVDEVDR